ncbi:30S ribosomal protein S4 [Candidatus Micrarchaeota archaeon CG1_02_49_24]|nr:MAG: 30S ribosomal protein S4 [Candidatus Micrarchaeota archaeon CG1_02_49_24]
MVIILGDPKKPKKRYESPKKVWDLERISTESKLIRQYGLKSSRELWTFATRVKKFRRYARELLPLGEDGVEKAKPMIARLVKFGILTEQTLDGILSLTTSDLLDRRLQSLVFKKGFAKSIAHARQLITHGAVTIKGRRITVPGYLVSVDEEPAVAARVSA